MTALIREEIPGRLIPRGFIESNQFPGIVREIRGVLVASPIDRLFCQSLIPLLAGNLTPPASGTFRCIDKIGFSL
jgi:hypothetical protein